MTHRTWTADNGPAVYWQRVMFVVVLAATGLPGCSGLQTFSQSVLPGDTVAVTIDRQPHVSRDQATIVIQDASGTQSFPATDPSIRGWINLYPDPVSRVVVGRETNQRLGTSASAWGIGIDNETGGDKDWFETVLFIDLPPTLAAGAVSIDVVVGGASILAQPVALNILPGAPSAPHPFDTFEWGPLEASQFKAMERADHYTVNFTGGSEVPAAIQITLTHDPDSDNGGTGQVYVIPPRGDLKSINWTDSGTDLNVVLLPTWQKTPEDQQRDGIFNRASLQWFKFYIAGGVTGLQVVGVQAFDSEGHAVPGIQAALQ